MKASRRRTIRARRGLTLLEILLSLALLGGAMAAVSQLITTGTQAAVQSRLRSQAILLCETKMAEVVAGAVPLQVVSGATMPEATPDWTWSLVMGPGPRTDVLQVQVTVSHQSRRAGYTLTRLMRDPQIVLDAILLQQQADAEAAAAGTSGNTTGTMRQTQ